MDTYTKVVLTVIAVALSVIALRGFHPVSPAQAADTLECEVKGPMEIRGSITIEDFRDKLEVEVEQGYAEAGSSTSSPLYVKDVD